jgi:hypothetical protein
LARTEIAHGLLYQDETFMKASERIFIDFEIEQKNLENIKRRRSSKNNNILS